MTQFDAEPVPGLSRPREQYPGTQLTADIHPRGGHERAFAARVLVLAVQRALVEPVFATPRLCD
jgi:hypothetical protein